MPATTHVLTFPGALNERGFWLYVWRIKSPKGELLYVGRTGDSSSPNASSPIKRMGQHLDPKAKSNMVHRHLKSCGVRPESCDAFEMVAYGPLYPEEDDFSKHKKPRDAVAALEKKLADSLRDAKYNVMNKVNSKKDPDNCLWAKVHEAFVDHFPNL